jgi:hypothetical protein
MIKADAEVLKVDPAQIALGSESGAAAPSDPEGPACAASLSAFRSNLFFKNIFTGLVAVLAAFTVGALAFCIIRVIVSSWEPATTLAAIAAVVTGGGALYLQKERSRADKVLKDSLTDVGRYCGTDLRDGLK